VLAALLSTLLGVPTQTTTELQEAAVLQASIESFAERVQ
jgi:hypothetical protein